MMADNDLLNSTTQLKDLKKLLENAGKVLIVTHGNPDPDAIAAAFALKYLVSHMAKNKSRVAYPGIIGRKENRAMVKDLSLKMIPVDEVVWRDYDILALVDHQPRRRFYTWPKNRWPNIVIDHHPRRPLEKPVDYVDVRTEFGSNSSLLTSYLLSAELDIPRWLSTALAYGITTDTHEFSHVKSDVDKQAYMAIFEKIDHSKLFRISHPLIDCRYLSQYWKALSAARIWQDTVESYAGEILVPDNTAEIADNLVKIQGVKYALVSGFYENTVYMSLRFRNARRDAGAVMRRIVGRKGSAGGHGFMAGAQIKYIDSAEKAQEIALSLHEKFVKLLRPKLTEENVKRVLSQKQDCGASVT
jgi:nanoRNase/pAp phosphatase (c-di-AMP/oligoRNAs hydrolase)